MKTITARKRGQIVAGVLAAAGAAMLLSTASAQPFQTISDSTIVPLAALEGAPHAEISNGIVSAKVYLPGPAGFYGGTRFDHNGIVAHATYKGQDYGRPWFSGVSRAVHDFTWHKGQVIVQPASAVMGPAEEFDSIGFQAAGMGGDFLKIGIGMLKRDTEKEDHVHPYPIVNAGSVRSRATKTDVRITQTMNDKASGYGYRYTKTIRMVPGKAQMVIEHSLTNTGGKDIDTNVYCHNFLTLSPGNENITITAPFAIKAERHGARLGLEMLAPGDCLPRHLRPVARRALLLRRNARHDLRERRRALRFRGRLSGR